MALWKTAFFFAASGLLNTQTYVSFEPKPRAIVDGRDPQLAVRASGAISLLKVDRGNLCMQTSSDGLDSFEPCVQVNDIDGEVVSHGENSPILNVRSRSEMYSLWQARRPGHADSSALRFARSMDWGESFTKAIDVDPSPGGTSQGFYTMNVSPSGVVYAAWLDGRERGQGRPGTAAVYLARSTNRGVSFEKSVRVSFDSCPCCRPNIAFAGDKTVHVAWRKVLDGNVRDIFVSTSHDAGSTWDPPVRVAEDNWILNGCPHSGAALATLGRRLFIAWYTVREQEPQLSMAYSDDAGRSFSRRYGISETVLDPNHPFLQTTGDKLSIVFQGRDAKAAQGWAPVNVYYREIDAQARLSRLQRVGHAEGSASYPVFAFDDPNRFYLAWTESAGERHRIVVARGRRTKEGARAQ